MARKRLTSKENLLPFILITSLFFLWGMAHGMLDILNKHFQDILVLTKAKSGLIQFSLYMAYFTMALPAGFFLKKYGYKKGIIFGLLLFSGGAFLIASTTSLESFWIFLISLFILGCGLATLETAANPYTTILGPKESAEQRINFSQSFNGLAWIVGPLIGIYIYSNSGNGDGEKLGSLALPYFLIGTVVFIFACIYFLTKLPEIEENIDHSTEANPSPTKIKLSQQRHFVLGVVAQFCYVAAQTGIFSYLINFVTDKQLTPNFPKVYSPYFLSIGFALFMIGRLSGSAFMRRFKPARLLAVNATAICLLLPIVSIGINWVSLIALYAVFFFMSIMFPTIFALGIKNLRQETKKASSFMVMSIVGGALFPILMGWISDNFGMAAGFFTPIPCFVFILYYAVWGYKIKSI